jgi:DNA repair ATPase RecN
VTSVEETEWYLLSRLAAQRSVSYAGSVPLVLDDALAGVKGDNLVHLLSRLERMSTAVQLVVVSEDAEVAAWADSLGPDRAMTLYPVPV